MNNVIKTRPLGRTSLAVSELGFGSAAIGNLYQAIDDNEAHQCVRTALENGFRLFDTAPYYGFGLSERRLGDVLRTVDRQSFVLSTKVARILQPAVGVDTSVVRSGFRSPMPFEAVYDYSYDGIMRSYEDSLQRLGLASIDILLVHDIGRATHGSENQAFETQLTSGGYRALDELRSNGDIAAIGLGVNEVEVCDRLMDSGEYDCFLLAGRYTLLEQKPIESFLPKCAARGASIILGGPYNSGILATGTRGREAPYFNYKPAPRSIIERVAAIEAVCDDFGVTLAAAALQFPLAHSCVASVIPGLDSASRVTDTLDLYHEAIPREFWEALKERDLLHELAPIPGSK